jgi:hypothetical protein
MPLTPGQIIVLPVQVARRMNLPTTQRGPARDLDCNTGHSGVGLFDRAAHLKVFGSVCFGQVESQRRTTILRAALMTASLGKETSASQPTSPVFVAVVFPVGESSS